MSFGRALLLILDTLISIFLCIMQCDEKELDTQFTPNLYFWTPNSEILAKDLDKLKCLKEAQNYWILLHMYPVL